MENINSKKHYAGIGARDTPPDICFIMSELATWLAEENWILRSGGANGADTAFEKGCDVVQGLKEIFLPEKGYNGNASDLYSPPQVAYDLIDKLWPEVKKRSLLARALLSRNCQQILGVDLISPSKFVICWTRNGEAFAGTGRSIKVANNFNIPVFNLHNETLRKHFSIKDQFLKEIGLK